MKRVLLILDTFKVILGMIKIIKKLSDISPIFKGVFLMINVDFSIEEWNKKIKELNEQKL